jgi:hypothetical protein
MSIYLTKIFYNLKSVRNAMMTTKGLGLAEGSDFPRKY